ncbi:MAG: hypothetical protein AB3N18_13375 [Allomuricauda sp.]
MDDEISLKKIIAAYNPFQYYQIDLSKKIQDRYVPLEFRDSFVDDICNKWNDIDCTELHNELFNGIKTGNDIITFIND